LLIVRYFVDLLIRFLAY